MGGREDGHFPFPVFVVPSFSGRFCCEHSGVLIFSPWLCSSFEFSGFSSLNSTLISLARLRRSHECVRRGIVIHS